MPHYLPPLLVPPLTWIGLALAAGLYVLNVVSSIRPQWWKLDSRAIGGWSKKAASFAAVAAGAILVFATGPTLLTFYFPALFSSRWVAVLAAVVALFLFLLRRRSKAIYGTLEIIGAAVTLIIIGGTSYGSWDQRAAALLGAIYFLIRGLDNADQGELIGRVRAVPEHHRMLYIFGGFMICLVLVGVFLGRPGQEVVRPPYLSHARGPAVPVSAMKCGELFVICDIEAWRERDRLKRATPGERAKADAEAHQRWLALAKKLKIANP